MDALWKERNWRTFDGVSSTPQQLLSAVTEEAQSWGPSRIQKTRCCRMLCSFFSVVFICLWLWLRRVCFLVIRGLLWTGRVFSETLLSLNKIRILRTRSPKKEDLHPILRQWRENRLYTCNMQIKKKKNSIAVSINQTSTKVHKPIHPHKSAQVVQPYDARYPQT